MKLLLFLLFLLSSFVMAEEGGIGVVRINNTQLPLYDNTGQEVPGSSDTLLKIRSISVEQPDEVTLLTFPGESYDAIVVVFKDSRIFPDKFEKLLSSDEPFEITIDMKNLKFDAEEFLSVLRVRASDLKISNSHLKTATNLQNVVCPLAAKPEWLPWLGRTATREDCL